MTTEAWRRLRDDVRLDVFYEDETPSGSALGGGADGTVRRACNAIVGHRARHGMDDVVACSERLLSEAFAGDLSALYERSDRLREDCLYPPADRVRPVGLVVRGEGPTATSIASAGGAFAELASWMGDLQRGMPRPSSPTGRALFDPLDACGALTRDPVEADPPLASDVVLVGHATAMLTEGARILVDPFLLPVSARYPDSYQPLRAMDLSPVDAVLITHSHPDHFDPGTLLRLGASTPIYVPDVERESLLAVDMASRLEQLGFSNVRRVRPGAEAQIAGVTVRTFPFFGEQPTTGDALHPEVRNIGCTYLCESSGHRILFVADSGRDRDGDVRDVGRDVRRRFGDVDVLFGGYRAFAVYPIQYVFSSVARFLLFVPRTEWTIRQKCMNDGDALLDTAEGCGAKIAVPYADGGAPWHWERGLGPRLDGQGTPHPAVDPPPEEVVRRAFVRSSSREGPIPSPVQVMVVRPGEGLRLADAGVRIEHGPRQRWPYAGQAWTQLNVALRRRDGSALQSAREVFRALGPTLARWRDDRRLECFYFMRKPPDLRLRFLGDETLSGAAAEILAELAHDGAIERWFPSVYEPETDRFGGNAAMGAVHRWFDRDTAHWMRLDSLPTDTRTVPPEAICLAVASHLVDGTVADRAEAGAVWRSYAAALGTPAGPDAPELDPIDLESLASRASAQERDILGSYQEDNRALSGQLRDFWATGALTGGLRSILGTVILFHFHRHGLAPTLHARIARALILARDG